MNLTCTTVSVSCCMLTCLVWFLNHIDQEIVCNLPHSYSNFCTQEGVVFEQKHVWPNNVTSACPLVISSPAIWPACLAYIGCLKGYVCHGYISILWRSKLKPSTLKYHNDCPQQKCPLNTRRKTPRRVNLYLVKIFSLLKRRTWRRNLFIVVLNWEDNFKQKWTNIFF